MRNLVFLAVLAAALVAVSQETWAEESRIIWKQTGILAAPEAVQAAAADDRVLYAINNTHVAKYDRQTGRRLGLSTGAARHLNSGFLWQGRLYCAHSNYPLIPEQSELKVLDPETMQLSTFKDFGNFGGSLTWAIRDNVSIDGAKADGVKSEGGRWWCNFARYGDDNAQTFLVKFDDQWQELARWTYPGDVIGKLGRYSLSGGIWREGDLLVTGHDDPLVFRLRLPAKGTVLEFVDTQPVPFTGQGIATDPRTGGLVGIHRARRQVVFAGLDAPTPVPRLPRENLLVYRGPNGDVLPVDSKEDWPQRRAEIIAGMETIMGRLPGQEKRCPLDVTIVEEVDCGSYMQRLITYASEPGSRVPAYLCIPKGLLAQAGAQAPAVLCLHGTDNVVGHGTVVGLGTRPNRQYASELAERGYVTLSPNYPLLAKYQPDLEELGWESGTLKAVWDNLRGLDLLESLPFVKREGFGAIGHSLGGHNAVYTSVFDERLKVVISSCGLDAFPDYYGGDEQRWLPGKGWTQPLYMPRLAGYRNRLNEIPFDFPELIGALAPRPVLIIAPLRDHNFQAASVDRLAGVAREIYKLHGAADRLQVAHPDCAHDFPPEVRETAYKLFDAALRPAPAP